MRIFLAGATGAIGRRLVPLLIADGHQVTGMTRSPEKAQWLRTVGAEPVVADALDGAAVKAAVREAQPEAVIHQLTALPQRIDPRKMERDFVLNDRLRSEGTRLLVDAARAAGARRIVAQSIAFAYAPGPPGTLHRERDPLFLDAPKSFRRSARALADLESTVLGANGIVLRYGYFYGPGSSISSGGSMAQDLGRRRLPIVGRGTGVWSFIHIDDAARATVAALAQDGSGVYNIVDDDPATVAEWIPALAKAVNAPRPWRVPAPIARLIAGGYGVTVMTRGQGASNELAKRELGWQPTHASWREGFQTALG
ncbi:MAG TPA: NAD(P)-dependent oxidoreductase [Solirubrobacteraceae bacterium]|jgi:nucleoside-diphosphate-sugar epimerase|nr:NAD(P)-dependent oxidoreductase [Solirubrobacteraceae bacterium]